MSYSDQHYGAGQRDCEVCHGIGYIRYEVPPGHERFGKIYDCECRQSNTEEAIRLRAKLAGVGADGWKMDADFWRIPERKALEDAVKELARDIGAGNVSGWLTLVTPLGLGKSAMGEWLVLQAVRAGHKAWFMTARDFKDAVSQHIEGDGTLLARAVDVKLLVFDQPDWTYGGKNGETYQENMARDILDRRYRDRDSKATVLLVNLHAWEERAESGLAAIFNRAEEGKILISKAKGVRATLGEVVGGQA